jgi:cellulose synthase/poly-beta-1,6-N-acetylglucosamine synthase-like glycosyltransferase
MTGATLTGAILLGLGALHVVYTYAAYPWLVSRLPRRAPKLSNQVTAAPSLVSVIIAARVNAQAQIEGLVAKVRQVLGTAWLPCEVVVAVDGSSTALAAALEGVGDDRLHVVTVPPGSGKAVALNHGVAVARGDVLVFTDVRQEIQPGSIEDLIRSLASPDVGAVAGSLLLSAGNRREGLYERYWHFERDLRAREAAWDSAIGVSGALYALKRELWQPLPPGLILDDVWVPFQVIRAGKRVAFSQQATATDRGAGSDAGELARKVRTLTGNYQLLAWMPWLLNPWRNRVWWQFVSHKVLRLLTPLALACAVVGAALLLPVTASVAIAAALAVAFVARPRRKVAEAGGGPGVGISGGLRSAGVLLIALVMAALNAVRGRWDVWSAGVGEPQ